VGRGVLEQIEEELGNDSALSTYPIAHAFERLERDQPELADHALRILSRPLDETALSLGYFLVMAIFLAFERTFGERLTSVSADGFERADQSLTLEEQLRAEHIEEPLELEDVVAIEQPGIIKFMHEHLEAALETGSVDQAAEPRDVDVDDVHVVYRMALVFTLALSHAVLPRDGGPLPAGANN
jgi:hypothetical protein